MMRLCFLSSGRRDRLQDSVTLIKEYFYTHVSTFASALVLPVPFLSVDHSRVKLNFTTSKNDSDYINASFIRVNQRHPHDWLGQLMATLWRICCPLFPGGVQFHWIHRHSGSFAPHAAGLLQDALGTQHRGASSCGHARLLQDTTFCLVMRFLLVFVWLQVVVMACREFEMGKVTLFSALPFPFFSLNVCQHLSSHSGLVYGCLCTFWFGF